MGFSGSGGSSGSIATSSDVALSSPSMNDVLTYSTSTSKWHNQVSTASASPLVTPNVQTANYTLVLGDAGKAIELNSASAVTLTVPPSSAVAFTIGTMIEIFQRGSGQITITPGSGVTLRTSSATGLTRTQYSVATLRLSTTNEWVLAGDLS